MNAQNRLATLQVRAVNDHLTVEATGAQQRRIQDVGTVGCGNQNDVVLDVETIHFDQQLVQRLLPLVMTPAQAGAPATTDRVDLVDEDDRGALCFGLLKEVADSAGADTHKHLNEIRARDGEERHVRLTGDGTSQQGLTGTRRAYQQNALRNLCTQRLEACWVRQVVLNFF